MANMPSPPSLPSVSIPDNLLSPKTQVDGGGENNVDAKSSQVAGDFDELYAAKMAKFKTYEDDYTRRLMAKYFSKKNLYGGDIFDGKIKIEDEFIKSSRWPCTRSYADPVQAFEDHSNTTLTSILTTITDNIPSNFSNGKHLPEKSG